MSRHFTYTFLTFVTIFALSGGVAADRIRVKPGLADYERPLRFEPNLGQTDKTVDFLAHGAEYNLFLSHAAAVMTFGNGTAVWMKPLGAYSSLTPDALDEQPSKSNYFIGNKAEKWHTNVPNYGKVRYGDVYPGVDLVYYGNQRQLEYDFVVHTGADPNSISLQFDGPAQTALDASGDLVMRSAAGEVRWHKPVAYQELNGHRKIVECAYMRSGADRLRFSVGTYDRARPLIIDPVLDYSTYLGGSAGDGAQAIAVDARGNAYITGFTYSADFPIKNAFQTTNKGLINEVSNAFVTKFDPTGKLVYSTFLGGSGSVDGGFGPIGDQGNAIAVDLHGNAYVTGFTASFDFPIKNAFQPAFSNRCEYLICPGTNAFVTELDATGSALVYSTYLGGAGRPDEAPQDAGKGIAVDTTGQAYVTGSTTDYNFPLQNAFQTTPGGIFVTKFEPGGSAVVYSTFLGVVGDAGAAIALDAAGNAYVTGSTDAPDFPTKNPFQAKEKTINFHAFVTKFDPEGTALVYSTYLGGSGKDLGKGIAVDAEGNAYITGQTTSADFPQKDALQKKLKSSNGNAFVTKLDTAGNALVYSTYLGGSGTDSGNGIAVDKYGQAYVIGSTSSTDFPVVNAFQATNAGGVDAFVTKINAGDCALVYSSYLGGSGNDVGGGIALDANANTYVAGSTFSNDFPTTANAFQNTPPNAHDKGFVTKISTK